MVSCYLELQTNPKGEQSQRTLIFGVEWTAEKLKPRSSIFVQCLVTKVKKTTILLGWKVVAKYVTFFNVTIELQ